METVIDKTTVKKYPAYKDSGVLWLGDIPSSWEVTKLRNIGVFSASGIDKYLKVNESKVKIINFTDIYANKSMTLDSSFDYMVVTTPESNRIKHLVKKGDLIFLPSSETYEDLGAAALVNEELENTSFSYHVIRLVFQKDIEHAFRKYLTNNAFVLNQFSRQGKGSTRKIIGRGVFKDVQVIIPPLPQQTAIANFLDRKTALIDQAIDIKQNQIELLKERRQILIHKAITRGLNPNVKLIDSKESWLGEIPENWEYIRVKNIFKLIIDPAPINNDFELLSVYTDIGVKPRAELEERGNKASTTDGYWLVKKGDIIINKLLAWMGAIGISDYDGVTSPAYDILRAMRPINGYYYHNLFRMPSCKSELKKHSRGIMDMRLRLYFDKFGDIRIPYPPIDEQNSIVEYLTDITNKIATAISLKEQEIEKLKEYKATLINSAVTGKIKVS